MSADEEQQPSPANPEISKETFMRLDSNGDGYISKNEFRNSLKKEGCFEKEDAVDAAWSHFDKNTDGRICFGGKKFRKIQKKINEIFCQKFVIFSEFKQGIDTLNETPVLEQKQSKPLLYQIFCCYKYKS